MRHDPDARARTPRAAGGQIARFSQTALWRSAGRGCGSAGRRGSPGHHGVASRLEQYSRWGFWKCFVRLRAVGHPLNHKRVYRVHCALGFNHVRRTKKRLPQREVVPLNAPARLNDTWAMDFMGDSLYRGRSYRLLNLLDEGNREALANEVDVSLPSARTVVMLEELVAQRGAPRQLRSDNDLEFIAEALRAGYEPRGIDLAFIRTWQTDSERLHRALQPQRPRGSARCVGLQHPRRGPRYKRSLAPPRQHRTVARESRQRAAADLHPETYQRYRAYFHTLHLTGESTGSPPRRDRARRRP